MGKAKTVGEILGAITSGLAVDVAVPEGHDLRSYLDSVPNPKDQIGVLKVNLALVPAAAKILMAGALEDGAVKYGPYNWRSHPVQAMIYLAAAERHIEAWKDGEENASDSGKHHLGHAMACLAILVDALESGNLIDDRPKPGPAARLIAERVKKR